MFSMRLRNDRLSVNCMTYYKYPKITEFVFDTGAKYTCCSYNTIDDGLVEDDFRGGEYKILGGFVSGKAMLFYKLSLKQFTIGNLDIGKKDIWITFDERISDSVLGLDLIKNVIYLSRPLENRVLLFNSEEECKNFFI